MSSILFYSTGKTQELDRICALKGSGLLDLLTSILLANITKIEGEHFGGTKTSREKKSKNEKFEQSRSADCGTTWLLKISLNL